MPFDQGVRITLAEWQRRYPPHVLSTTIPSVEDAAPIVKAALEGANEQPTKPQKQRSATAKAAIAAATGVDLADAPEISDPSVPVSDLDAEPVADQPDDEAGATEEEDA